MSMLSSFDESEKPHDNHHNQQTHLKALVSLASASRLLTVVMMKQPQHCHTFCHSCRPGLWPGATARSSR